ncbi:MAG: hypothetical protein EHM20_15090, partial [Alphaproteobacteria bacterium]
MSGEPTYNAIIGFKRSSRIGEVFVEISMNLLSMRTNLKAAIFSEDFGIFRQIYSGKIRNTMLLFT